MANFRWLISDRGVAALCLTGGTALCPWARHHILCLVLVQPRKTFPTWLQNCWLGRKEWTKNKQTNKKTNNQNQRHICAQFGTRAGPAKLWAWSECKLHVLDTLMIFLKEYFHKSKFWNTTTNKQNNNNKKTNKQKKANDKIIQRLTRVKVPMPGYFSF